MQITESARAKALTNNSPRSSPDVQGKEAYLKKRRSLPGSISGRHGSPRVKRASQQTTKGTNNPGLILEKMRRNGKTNVKQQQDGIRFESLHLFSLGA
ncbi:hypothetical protein R6Q59_007285 [Mikania micrantha]